MLARVGPLKENGEGRVTAHWTPVSLSPQPDMGDMVTEEATSYPSAELTFSRSSDLALGGQHLLFAGGMLLS